MNLLRNIGFKPKIVILIYFIYDSALTFVVAQCDRKDNNEKPLEP